MPDKEYIVNVEEITAEKSGTKAGKPWHYVDWQGTCEGKEIYARTFGNLEADKSYVGTIERQEGYRRVKFNVKKEYDDTEPFSASDETTYEPVDDEEKEYVRPLSEAMIICAFSSVAEYKKHETKAISVADYLKDVYAVLDAMRKVR